MTELSVLDLVPQSMDIRLYAGDGVTIKLTFLQDGQPLDMSNGEIKAQIRHSRLDLESPPAAFWAVEASESSGGIVILSLTGEETAALISDQVLNPHKYRYGWKGSWDVQWHPTDLEPITLFQGTCFCDADVTR